MFAFIWIHFKDECRAHGTSPEKVLEEWEQNERILEHAQKQTERNRFLPDKAVDAVSWADADRRAMENFSRLG